MRAVTFLVLMGMAQVGEPAWEKYTGKNDQFTVKFPGRPLEEERTSPFGTPATAVSVKAPTGVLYSVVYGESGLKGIPTDEEKKKFLDGAQRSAKGALLRETPITLG